MYEDMSTPAQELCYKFIEAYDDAQTKDAFIQKMKAECPDVGILEAIWELIDYFMLGGGP